MEKGSVKKGVMEIGGEFIREQNAIQKSLIEQRKNGQAILHLLAKREFRGNS